ncbi:conserved hypothetical protein [Vibrio parahaemolyticus Peru-466]|nr:conserved hypothetical protein [Vibrio parahaemolyticus Peru-466]EFO40455.1 conserved hypothetical protein [Vibrio parahaemolyticus AN-5034]EFO50348.1 conserved hypothetical protein [Vibrio parahaemolyticus K5030]EQL97169.1 hypothetical protein D040_1653 [Vibrio parahaemolyticus NIHCB0603]EQM45193.1 hypothetical protein D025_0234 [Vibrio parahaemolyticus 949]ETT11944.1 hypothetical protein D026_1461 [Vibrio parahaemolyticus 605]ETX24187.1 hypothetical protein D037_2188 [Vibrio parahaemolyt
MNGVQLFIFIGQLLTKHVELLANRSTLKRLRVHISLKFDLQHAHP